MPYRFRTKVPNNFSLPRRIERLGELAYNMWWTWNADAQRLFLYIDRQLWESVNHNPLLFLRRIERSKLNAVTHNRYYLEFYDRILHAFDRYMESREDTWFLKMHQDLGNRPIAYFSMEYGLHQIFPVYAGGLGVLSGDHVKEASDLGLPFVAIGLFYSEGYFTQNITEDGWQEARYTRHPLEDLPILPVTDENEQLLTVTIEAARTGGGCPYLGDPCRQDSDLSPGYQYRAEHARRPYAISEALQQRPGYAYLSGDLVRDRWYARPANPWL